MDIQQISFWLKDTIPGIICLGAIGSILSVFLMWIILKILPVLWKFFVKILAKTFGDKLFKYFIVYFRIYFIKRATLLQLINKKRFISAQVLYQTALANRNLAWISFFILFSLTFSLFLFTGVTYTKTAICLVTLSFLNLTDAIAFTVWCIYIQHHFYGQEKDLAKRTYKDKEAVLIEGIYGIGTLFQNLKNAQDES